MVTSTFEQRHSLRDCRSNSIFGSTDGEWGDAQTAFSLMRLCLTAQGTTAKLSTMVAKPKRPHDKTQRAKFIAELATGEIRDKTDDGKNPAAVALGRMGGLRGGKARAESLSKKRRAEIAKEAARARWKR